MGAERFEQFTRYRRDPLLPRLLGLPRFPSPDTLRRFFPGFTYRRTTEVSEALMRVSLQAMRPILLGHTLDLDSTVFCRYGEQAGSLKGHNPVKHGRPSHHPVVAWLSERRRLVSFNFKFQPSIDVKVIRELATSRYLDHGENVWLLGPPGVGKTLSGRGVGDEGL